MKTLILATSAGIALASFSGAATAGCSASPVNTVVTLANLLRCNTVCVPDPAAPANWKWQEFHKAADCTRDTGSTTGELWDYKEGTNPMDPSEKVGTWTVSGTASGSRAQVVHDYGAGQIYRYSVYNNGNGTISFCSGAPEITATIKTGQVACK